MKNFIKKNHECKSVYHLADLTNKIQSAIMNHAAKLMAKLYILLYNTIIFRSLDVTNTNELNVSRQTD